ncbi:uncharacterized protein [Lolium perenne]|uniref:uncharacterized protein n=1 Tax=Lolium perenne TaxID=4522 RepID=UPI0021F67CF8|nr:uncharacterized protein LOC127304318 [Lolium perenne]
MATTAPPPTPEYLNWSDPLVINAQIGGFDMSKVFMDAGSAINLIYTKTLRAMNISLANLTPSEICFHGIVPGKPEIPVGTIALDVVFGSRENFRREKIDFEVMDWPSQYHAILGRPAYSRFMAVSHHTYLVMKIPGPNGVITVKGSFTQSDACDREFNKISQSFGMQAEYVQLKDSTDHNVTPEVRRSVPDQVFDSTKDTREVQIHPNDPKKTTFVAANLEAA